MHPRHKQLRDRRSPLSTLFGLRTHFCRTEASATQPSLLAQTIPRARSLYAQLPSRLPTRQHQAAAPARQLVSAATTTQLFHHHRSRTSDQSSLHVAQCWLETASHTSTPSVAKASYTQQTSRVTTAIASRRSPAGISRLLVRIL